MPIDDPDGCQANKVVAEGDLTGFPVTVSDYGKPQPTDTESRLAHAALELGQKQEEIEQLKMRLELAEAKQNAEHEKIARAFREQIDRTEDGKADGTAEGLLRCATMFDTYAPDIYPANEKGQVHFARAMMESVATEIRAFLAKNRESGFTVGVLKQMFADIVDQSDGKRPDNHGGTVGFKVLLREEHCVKVKELLAKMS